MFTTDAMHVRFETLANVAHFPFTRSQKPLITCNPPGVELAILICDLVLRTRLKQKFWLAKSPQSPAATM